MEVTALSCAPGKTMGAVLDEYLILRGVQNKKYFAGYAVAAMRAWKDIFQQTMFVQASSWQMVKEDKDGLYIDMPAQAVRFFSVNTLDECNNLVSLYYNPQMNVVSRPKAACSCNDCGCASGLCEDANSTVMTTKLMFTINNTEYFEKKWVKYCKNGDVIEYTETPVKKYNDTVGAAGDFNTDYNDDYSIGLAPGLENFNIVYVTKQKVICKLETEMCGCPKDTEENNTCFYNACGTYLNNCCAKKRCCPIFSDINGCGGGEVKFRECGTKIEYRPSREWYNRNKKLPTHLLISYQVSGEQYNSEVIIPDYAEAAMHAGVDFYTKRFNNKYNPTEKREAMYAWEMEKQNVVGFLNPISFEFLKSVQDAEQKW